MNYTVAETYELPSKGLVYNEKVNPLIKLRSMTTEHEMQRLNHSDRPMKIMADIIDDCMLEPCGVSSYDMCIPDYQYLLHKIRVVTYGPDYNIITTCPLCGTQVNRTLNLDEFPIKLFDESMKQFLSFELPRTKDRISIKMQTPRSLDTAQVRAKERKKQMSSYKGDFEFLMSLLETVDLVNGEKINDFQLEDYIRKLPLADSNYILNMSNKFTESFGLETTQEVICDACGLAYKSPFRITSEFYRPEI